MRIASLLPTAALAALLLFCSSKVPAQSEFVVDPADQRRTISVSGSSEIMVVPDEVTLTFTIETTGKKASPAEEENARKYSRFIEVIDSLGIDRSNVQTKTTFVRPQYRWDAGRQKITGYLAVRTLTITLNDFTKISPLFDGALDAGMTAAGQGSYRMSGMEEKQDSARVAAVREARTRAEAMAAAAGMSLGPAIRIAESTGFPHGFTADQVYGGVVSFSLDRKQRDEYVPAELIPGEIPITARVTILFELGG